MAPSFCQVCGGNMHEIKGITETETSIRYVCENQPHSLVDFDFPVVASRRHEPWLWKLRKPGPLVHDESV